MDGGFTDLAIGKLRFLGNVGNMLLAKPFADTHIVEDVLDWDFFEDHRLVPNGTRTIEVYLDTSRSIGISSDGFFDNASLILTSTVPEPFSTVPEPSSMWLFVVGAIMGWVRRRRSA